jgi:sphingomyelin phosphodiesterase
MNLKVIAMNSQACNDMNWYLLRDPTDPGNQLKWIREELYDAERRNLSVYIISHIPPGQTDCLEDWVERYNVLIDRFSHIIRGQFFGHTHSDHFELFRDVEHNQTNNIVFIAPSLTTYSFR